MIGTIFLALVIVPIIEIAIFIEVGGALGFWPTMGIVVLTAFVGAFLLRHQGLATLEKARASLDQNRFPVDEVFAGLCLLVAGALLLTPGFFTDALGLLLFVPALRRTLGRQLLRYLAARGQVEVQASGFQRETGPGVVIDGDYQDVTPGADGPADDQGDVDGERPALPDPPGHSRPPPKEPQG